MAGVMSVPLLLSPGTDFPERDLLVFIAAGVILLSLIAACIALPMLLRGVTMAPDEPRRRELRDTWRMTAEAAIKALEADQPEEPKVAADAAQAAQAAQSAMIAEVKARVMSEYRHQLDVFNDSPEAQALAQQMDGFERRLRVMALKAQRLELYSLHRHHKVGDDGLREVLAELDLREANGGHGK